MTVVQKLREAGYQAVHLREQGLQTLPDSAILEKAHQEDHIILTFDLDFGDLLAANNQSLPSVIIFRSQNPKPIAVALRLLTILIESRKELWAGAIITVEEGRYRLRKLPIQSLAET